MSQPKETYEELIVKYLAKELSPTEGEQLMKWIKELPERQRLFDHLQSTWTMAGLATTEEFSPNIDAAWKKVQQKIHKGQVDQERGAKVIKLFPTFFLQIAASIAVALFFGALMYSYLKIGNQSVVICSLNQRTLFVLPDSSNVWLQPNSTLAYEEGLEGKTREVQLTGEGFFEIKRNENKPFVVLGQKTRVQVLGTSFVVHSRPQDESEYVVVATGRVQFSELANERNRVVMSAGDKAIFSPTRKMEYKSKSARNAIAWKTGHLKFDNTSLRDVLSDLELYYSAKVEVDNAAMLSCQFTGDFGPSTLDQVMEVISVSLNATYHKNHGVYQLHGVGCP